MDNILRRKPNKGFTWGSLGDVKLGRANLGEEMPVIVYRLMQFTLMDVLDKKYGRDAADHVFWDAGYIAGTQFAKNVLNLKLDFNSFASHLQEKLKDLKIGILKIESTDTESGEIILTVGEDLDCSGLPVTDENVCVYDEGFLAGILESYSGKKYSVKEINCWASGDRVCRFRAIPSDT